MAAGWHIQDGQDARGRRIVADRAFRPGDVVLEDEAAAWCLITEQLGRFCDCCLAPGPHPLRCSACKISCYLDRDHQRRAWKAGMHRLECAALRSCAPRVPPTAVRLALRCMLRHWQASEGGGAAVQTDGSRYSEVLGLLHHWEDLQDSAKLECAQMGAGAHALLHAAAPEAAATVSARDLALLIARFGCNSHTVSDDELQPLAVGIFPLGAMVNHDCRPNTVHAFRGGRMLFRAVRAIQPGDEVTTCYIELAATRWERRAALLEHHLFDIAAPPAAATAENAAAAQGKETGAAAAATNAAAAGPSSSGTAARGSEEQQELVQAALQCMPSPPADVLPLASSSAELHVYSCQQPPWPHDERDSTLTAVVPAGVGGGGSSGNRSWGGMWGTLQHAGGSSTRAAAESFSVEAWAEDVLDRAAVAANCMASGMTSLIGKRLGAGPVAAGASDRAAVVYCWPFVAAAGDLQAGAEQLARRYAGALQLQQELDGMLTSGRAAAAAEQLAQALQALEGVANGGSAAGAAGLALGPRHVLRMRLLADLHRAALAAGQWEAALAAARQLLPLYEQAYQPVWPQLGLLWASIAKLEHLLEQPALALAAAQAAARILGCTHGEGGALVVEMQRLEFETWHELQQQQRGQEQLGAVVDG